MFIWHTGQPVRNIDIYPDKEGGELTLSMFEVLAEPFLGQLFSSAALLFLSFPIKAKSIELQISHRPALPLTFSDIHKNRTGYLDGTSGLALETVVQIALYR